MMRYYQEITLVGDEKPFYEQWSELYKQLHIALADVKNKHGIDGIGVSFPNYRYEEKNGKTFATLGTKLRIFAQTAEELGCLKIENWLERLTDYVHIKPIREVGNQATSYVVVRRYRDKDVTKQAENFADFKGISFQSALKHCREHKRAAKRYPFITLTSETTKQPYQLLIQQESVDLPVLGKFGAYGVNKMASNTTVPNW